jgi:flagellar hook-associated protein 2
MADLGAIKTGVGLGSGLPIQELVEQSVANTFDPKKERISARELEVQAKITTLGKLKSKLSELQNSVKELAMPNKMLAKTVNVQNNQALANPTAEYLGVTVNDCAQSGSYNVVVKNLAVTDSWVTSNSFYGNSAIVGTGTLNISIGNPGTPGDPSNPPGAVQTFQVVIGSENQDNTVGGICRLINQQTASTGVSATIINADNSCYLSISSNLSGLPSTLQITATNDNGTLQGLTTGGAPGNLTHANTATNAQILVNGAQVTVCSNTVVDVIEGVTFNLYQTTDDLANTVTIAADSSQTFERVEKFVEKYNSVIDYITRLTRHKDNKLNIYGSQANDVDDDDDNEHDVNKTEKNGKGSKKKRDYTVNLETGSGIFLGDSTIRKLRSDLSAAVNTQVNQTLYYAMSQIGITSDRKTGKLEINKDAFEKVINTNPNNVVNLFTSKVGSNGIGNSNGVGVAFENTLKNYLKIDGVMISTEKSLIDRLQSIAKKRLEIDLQAKRMEYDLTLKYSKLDKVLTQQENNGKMMMQSLASLQQPSKK